jgi:hypothetical protein
MRFPFSKFVISQTYNNFNPKLYKKQLFHVYENHKKYKQRFIDSIVDFCIQRNIIEWIPILQKEGYEPKKELYLYLYYAFSQKEFLSIN